MWISYAFDTYAVKMSCYKIRPTKSLCAVYRRIYASLGLEELTHRRRMTNFHANKLGQHCFRWWLVACLGLSYCMHQCWLIVKWTLWNKSARNLNKNETVSTSIPDQFVNFASTSPDHRLPVDSLKKRQWHGALMLSLVWAWTNDWANSRDAGDLRCQRAHYDDTLTP